MTLKSTSFHMTLITDKFHSTLTNLTLDGCQSHNKTSPNMGHHLDALNAAPMLRAILSVNNT